jgi:succinate-semialdehyde dehydrogenase / glutarate-semialdehyde dehydrogenase
MNALVKDVVGPGDQPGVIIGPLIDERTLDEVERHIQDAIAKGAQSIRQIISDDTIDKVA